MAFHSKDKFFEDLPAGFDGVFDWDFLLPIFEGTKITPMDIDAIIERNGNALIVERKRPGKDIPLGQKITLEFLLKTGLGKITIFHIADDFSLFGEWHFLNKKIKTIYHANPSRFLFYDRVSLWWKKANKGKP